MKKFSLAVGAAAIAVTGLLSHGLVNSAVASHFPNSTVGFEDAMKGMMKDMALPMTGIPDVDFVKGMIPHHEGAIAMARVQKDFGKDASLLKLADDIIKAQDGEIAVMKSWIAQANPDAMEQAPGSIEAGEQAMAAMMSGMHLAYTGNADADFVRGMVPHHQGAIDMAKVVLTYGKDAAIRKLAEGVIAAQQSEIAFMKEWLAKNGS